MSCTETSSLTAQILAAFHSVSGTRMVVLTIFWPFFSAVLVVCDFLMLFLPSQMATTQYCPSTVLLSMFLAQVFPDADAREKQFASDAARKREFCMVFIEVCGTDP